MKIVVGCDLEEFKEYYKTLRLEWDPSGKLGAVEEGHIRRDPQHLIALKEGEQILGHAIWHESNSEEHTKGDPRDEEDKRILNRLAGPRKEFVELHEIWLKTEHRGKGYGNRFFEFFEEFISQKGHDMIVYFADHPAALSICRKRGYREALNTKTIGRPVSTLCLPLKVRLVKD